MAALCYGQLYQKRLNKTFDKKVCPREFKEGDPGAEKIFPIHKDSRGKWTPNYESPYVVKRLSLVRSFHFQWNPIQSRNTTPKKENKTR